MGMFARRALSPVASESTLLPPPATLPRTSSATPALQAAKAAAGAVHVRRPNFAVAAHSGLDRAFAKGEHDWQARLEDNLDKNAKTQAPKPLLRGYVRERCALAVARRIEGKVVGGRDVVLEGAARGAVEWSSTKVGQAVAFSLAWPNRLVSAQGTALAETSGNATGCVLSWPLQATIEVLSLLVTGAALLAAAVGLAVGFMGGWALAAVVLALTPTAVCSAWLRGRSLEASARRHAQQASTWLHQVFGATAPAIPSGHGIKVLSMNESLEAHAGAHGTRGTRRPADPAAYAGIEALRVSYAAKVADTVAATPAAQEAQPQQVAQAAQDYAEAAGKLSWLSRKLLGSDNAAGVADGLAEADGQVHGLLAEAARRQRTDAILRKRQLAATASQNAG